MGGSGTAWHCCQHGQEMLSTHCPLGPPGWAGDPQVWPPQDRHSSLAWHQPFAAAAMELWQSIARVSPWMTTGTQWEQHPRPRAGRAGGCGGHKRLHRMPFTRAQPILACIPCSAPLSLHPSSLIPVSLSLACPIPSSPITTASVPPPLGELCPVPIPRRLIAAR